MKDKVLKLLLKWGNNQKDCIKMIESNFDYAMRTYPNSKASEIAKILRNIY